MNFIQFLICGRHLRRKMTKSPHPRQHLQNPQKILTLKVKVKQLRLVYHLLPVAFLYITFKFIKFKLNYNSYTTYKIKYFKR